MVARHHFVPVSFSSISDIKITSHLLSGNSGFFPSFSDTKNVSSWYMKKNTIIVMKQPHVFLTLIVAGPWTLINTELDQT